MQSCLEQNVPACPPAPAQPATEATVAATTTSRRINISSHSAGPTRVAHYRVSTRPTSISIRACWAQLELGEGVRLLLGWREGRRDLVARPVEVTDEVGGAMREACQATLNRIGALERRTFSGVPALEPDQYLSLPIETDEEVDEQDDEEEEVGVLLPEERAGTADLVELVESAFEDDDFLSRNELREGGWLFYAVVVEQEDEDEPIAFVRKFNPQRGMKAGRLPAAAQGNTLSRFDDPLFNFDLAFDLVVAPDEIAILKVGAFNTVFADLELAKAQVPEHVDAISAALGVKLASSAEGVLRTVCSEKPSLATRLRRLAHTDHLPKVTNATLREALDKHGFARNALGTGQRVRLADVEDVKTFLDLVEGLYYEADFSDEPRRADRFSVRA